MSKTILITGASTGIGAAVALRMALGNRVIVHYHTSREAAEEVAAGVQKRGGTALVAQADLSTESGCRGLAAFAAEHCGKLDVLVNNAGGVIRRQGTREFEWDLIARVFALNTFSAMFLSSQCVPLLEQGENPSIVNVTSIAIRHGAPTAAIYGAAKGALDVFTRGLARELAPAIRVNAVAPGVIETPFHDKYTTPERLAMFRSQTPLARNGTAEEIAAAVEFLIENQFTTGETLDVNGGLFMR